MTQARPACARDIHEAGLEQLPRSYLLCLSPAGTTANTCQGDSGSGVYVDTGGVVRAIGLTLGGSGCGPSDTGLYLSGTMMRAFLATLHE